MYVQLYINVKSSNFRSFCLDQNVLSILDVTFCMCLIFQLYDKDQSNYLNNLLYHIFIYYINRVKISCFNLFHILKQIDILRIGIVSIIFHNHYKLLTSGVGEKYYGIQLEFFLK